MRLVAPLVVLAAVLAVSASAAEPRERAPQITGGQTVSPDTWPFVVPVVATYADGSGILCSGSVIGARWVVTAAHCLTAPMPVSVDVLVGGALQRASDWFVNTAYDPATNANDIGVVRLPADFPGPAVRMAVEAETGGLTVGRRAIIVGWGATSLTDPGPPTLREATVQLGNPRECAYAGFAPSAMLCARRGLGVGTCVGDSGGPLLVRDPDKIPFLAGITSYGPADGCGSPSNADVFTSVATYSASLVAYLATDPLAPVGAPSVSTSTASATGDDGAAIEATISPSGLATTYRIEYGPGASPTASISGYAGAGGPVGITANLTELLPGTTYVYRVVAVSAAGAFAGTAGSFTTTGTPGPPVRGDAVPPFVRAIASAGRAGGTVRLRYRVFDETSRQTRERIVVRRTGGQHVATLLTRYERSERGVGYYRAWRTPRTLVGAFRFCVEAEDRAGNRSEPSCARLTLRP